MARRSVALAGIGTAVANLAGAVVVFALLSFVLPVPDAADDTAVLLGNLVLASTYALVAGGLGIAWGVRLSRSRLRWLVEEREPDADERAKVLGVPAASTFRQTALWTLGAIILGAANTGIAVIWGVQVFLTIIIGGLTTSATTFLLLERTGRPVVARAMANHRLRGQPGAGVASKTLLTWALGTGLPLAGITLLSGLAIGLDISRQELAIAVFVLGFTALAAGLISMTFVARSVADPLRSLRATLEVIEQGDLSVTVGITDTTEVGVLQSGLNRMVAGLRDRDRLRDLFGLHVGEQVAEQAMADGVELGGELRTAAALFIDVVGSTTMAEDLPPDQVLTLLNEFFAVVVEVVDEHGGVVNKFMGDAVLAIWGAPLTHPDPYSAALAAARELARRLIEEVPDVGAGIGVDAGTVVAGNLGAASRLEYTVIGDVVNVAARLSSLAKEDTGDVVGAGGHPGVHVLADAAVVDRADAEEQARWSDAGTRTLRGRARPTRLARPQDPMSSMDAEVGD